MARFSRPEVLKIVKLFLCEQVGGAEFLIASLGPCPWTRIMPRGIRFFQARFYEREVPGSGAQLR